MKKRTAPTCYRLLHTTRCRMQKPRDYELRVGFGNDTFQLAYYAHYIEEDE